MKRIVTLFIVCLLAGSCISDLEFNYNEVSEQIVVNSLFTVNSPWSVILSYTKETEDSAFACVENASVQIVSDDETISLSYSGDGEYTSESCPQLNKNYTLTVEVPGYETITASSSVPILPDFELQPYDTITYKYMFPGDLNDWEVMPFSMNLHNNDEQYFRVWFDGYMVVYRYYLTQESIENLREEGLPEDILAVLDTMVGQYYDNAYFFSNYFSGLADQYSSWYKYYTKAQKEVIKERVEEHDPEHFYATSTLSNCEWLANISSYTYSIIGKKGNNPVADIFLGDYNLFWDMQNGSTWPREYWLSVETCSPEFFDYYKTYALQVSQRMNSYADVVEVYTNVENGLGIFAGYNHQRVYLFEF